MGARPELKVLFITGFADDVLGERGVVLGEIEVVRKPISAGHLGQAVRRALDARKGQPG